MFENKGYNYITIWLGNRKKYNLAEHKLNALINNSLKDVFNKDKDVHHDDYCKLNNEPDNLKVISKSEHRRLHNKGKTLSEEHRRKIGEKNKGKLTGEKSPKWKDYARLIKGSFGENGKRRYILRYGGENIKRSIYKDELQKLADKLNEGSITVDEVKKIIFKNPYPRVVKAGFDRNGKQIYVLKHGEKIIKRSIYKDKLEEEAKEINGG